MPPFEPTDDELLRATPGDPEAFGTFYRRHGSAVLAYLLYRTRDAERALDLTAETSAAALQSSRRFRAGNGPARGWLFGIAKNVLADSDRRRSRAERARRRLGSSRLLSRTTSSRESSNSSTWSAASSHSQRWSETCLYLSARRCSVASSTNGTTPTSPLRRE
jgi:DNA-directed RNA polymerase specialized sigma24 family protein